VVVYGPTGENGDVIAPDDPAVGGGDRGVRVLSFGPFDTAVCGLHTGRISLVGEM